MKKILIILISGLIVLGMIGCSNSKKEITREELQIINNKIIEYFQNNGMKDYENYIFNYIDEDNNVVVVGLLDNSKEEQEKFKKNIVNSKFIKFVKSEQLTNY